MGRMQAPPATVGSGSPSRGSPTRLKTTGARRWLSMCRHTMCQIMRCTRGAPTGFNKARFKFYFTSTNAEVRSLAADFSASDGAALKLA